MATIKLALALALLDIAAFGVTAGDLVQGDDARLKPLIDDGSVDPHKDAVAAARKREARVVKLPPPPDPQRDAELAAAHARVHHLQGLMQASNAAEREALQPQLEAAQAALSALAAA